jgi:hypothetical protein
MLFSIVAAVALYAGGAFAEAVDFATYAPAADSPIYFAFPYVKENSEKIQKSNFYKMCTSEEMQLIFEEFGKMVEADNLDESPFFKAGFKLSDLLALKYGGFAVVITKTTPHPLIDIVPAPEPNPGEPDGEPGAPPPGHEPMQPPSTGAGAIYLDRANPEIKAFCDKIVKIMDQLCEGEGAVLKKSEVAIEGTKTVYYEPLKENKNFKGGYLFENGDVLVFATTKELATGIVSCIKGNGKGSLAQNELYTKAVAKLDPRHMTITFINIKASHELDKSLNGKQGKVASKFLEAIHADSIEAMASGAWADETGLFEHTYIYCPDGKLAFLPLLQNGRGTFTTLTGVSGKSLMSFSISMDPAGLYDWVMSMMKAADEKAYNEAIQSLAGVEKDLGMKMKEDILSSLGGEMTMVVTAPSMEFDAQFVPVPVAIMLEIRDAEKFGKFREALYKKFNWKPRTETFGEAGHKIEVLPYFVLCMTEKYCIIANGLRTMENILDVTDGKSLRLVDSKGFQTAMKAFRDKSAMLCYFNTKTMMRSIGFCVRVYQFSMAMQAKKRQSHIPQIYPGQIPPTTPAPPPAAVPCAVTEGTDGPAPAPGDGRMPPIENKSGMAMNMPKIMEMVADLHTLLGDYFPEYYMSVNGEQDGLSIRTAAP